MTTTNTSNQTKTLSTQIKAFWNDEEAATAVEYGLIAALIGAFIAGAVHSLGTSLSGLFSTIATHISQDT